MTRLVVLPLDCVQRLEDALRYAESHHTAHDSVRKVALAALLDLRRNWRYATEAEAAVVTVSVPAYDSQTVVDLRQGQSTTLPDPEFNWLAKQTFTAGGENTS